MKNDFFTILKLLKNKGYKLHIEKNYNFEYSYKKSSKWKKINFKLSKDYFPSDLDAYNRFLNLSYDLTYKGIIESENKKQKEVEKIFKIINKICQ